MVKPFVHEVQPHVWQLCFSDERNFLCAKTYRGKHAEELVKQDLAEALFTWQQQQHEQQLATEKAEHEKQKLIAEITSTF